MENKKLELVDEIKKLVDGIIQKVMDEIMPKPSEFNIIDERFEELKQMLLEEDTCKNASENMEV